MESTTIVKLQSLEPYGHLFPKTSATDKTMKKGAGVSDTVDFIPQVVKQCQWQVKDYVEQELKGLTTYKACEKLWHFVKYHIKYEKDKRGYEQVRSPRRLIHDAKGDCDCFTTFIDTCLIALGVKGIINRITKYGHDYFQHIYPIVPLGNGEYIIMDCVVDSFNYEEPYTEKEDHKMDLQFLDGIDGRPRKNMMPVEALQMQGYENDLGDLGKLFKKAAQNSGGAPAKKASIFKKPIAIKKPAILKKPILHKTTEQKQVAKQKRKDFGKKTLKVVNKINKVNPATLLLRAGILASMKLNVMKVAEKLKWGYASRELAQSKGMDMSKYDKVKAALAKTEQIFFAAGGKPENLRQSILKGNGNRDHSVSGLDGYNDGMSLQQMLGFVYADEFVNGMEGLGSGPGLGEPTTAASLAAASAAIGTIAAILKQIGELFPGKEKAKQKPGLFKRKTQSAPTDETAQDESSQDEGSTSEEPAEENEDNSASREQSPESTVEEPTQEQPEETTENLPAVNEENLPAESSENEENTEVVPSEEEEGTSGILSGLGGIKDFYQNNKKWIVPVGIGVATLTTVLIIGHFSAKPEPVPVQPTQQNQPTFNGIGRKKKRRKKKGGDRREKYDKQGVIALM